MSTIVVGAGGFTGFNYINSLPSPQDVIAVVSDSSKNSFVREHYQKKNVKLFSELENLVEFEFEPNSKFIYFGGYSCRDHTFSDIEKLSRAHITGVTQTLDIASRQGLPVLICGSYWENIQPSTSISTLNLYSAFQIAQNEIVEFYSSSKNLAIAKAYLVDTYGPNDWRKKLLPQIVSSIKTGEILKLGSRDQIIAPLNIIDVCKDLNQILISLNKEGPKFKKYQLSPERVCRLSQYIEIIESISGKNLNIFWESTKKERIEITNFPEHLDLFYSNKHRVSLEAGIAEVLLSAELIN